MTTKQQPLSPHPMLPVPQAIRIVLQTTAEAILQNQDAFGFETAETNASISQFVGRVLAQDVRMSEPGYPPFRASIMDGYAIKTQEFSGPGQTEHNWTHRVTDRVYAGKSDGRETQKRNENHDNLLPAAVYITTGAKIPEGCDCVIPIERVDESPDKQYVRVSRDAEIERGKFIRAVGCDIQAGSVVIPSGSILDPISLGLLLQSGCPKVQLVKPIKVGILSSGNELLVSPDAWAQKTNDGHGTLIQTGQIPDVNKPILASLVASFGNFQPIDLGIAKDDDADTMAAMLQDAVEKCDVILTTGGISMGETDIVEDILVQRLGGRLQFGRLNMKPGKPTTFVTISTSDAKKSCMVFALPGNPVSATVCTHLVVRPCLNMLLQYRGSNVSKASSDMTEITDHMVQNAWVQAEITAQLSQDIPLDNERPEYHRVTLSTTANSENRLEYIATSTGEQRSSRLMSLREAQGLLVLPRGSEQQPKALAGQRFPVLLLEDRHHSVRLKDSLHLRTSSDRSKPATRVAILQILEGLNPTEESLPEDTISEHVQRALSGSKSGSVKIIACDTLEGVAAETIGPQVRTLMARENDAIDVLVVSCFGSFSYSLKVSYNLRKEVVKVADAVALQARRGAAAQDGTAALFEPVAGFLLPQSQNEEYGCMLIAIPQAGLEGGLDNARGLVKHALNVSRGKSHHHHHDHGRHQHDTHH